MTYVQLVAKAKALRHQEMVLTGRELNVVLSFLHSAYNVNMADVPLDKAEADKFFEALG